MNTILRLGHLGLFDSAPLLVAQKRGYFSDAGLRVELSCELGLASLCAKLADERLAGACLPASLPVLLSLGQGRHRVPVASVLVTSYQDLAIARIERVRRTEPAADHRLRIGVLGASGSSRLVVQRWVERQPSLGPAPKVVLVPLSISQLLAFLADGLLEGCCAPEPLPLLASAVDPAAVITPSAALYPMHPGSAVAMHSSYLQHRSELMDALASSLRRACRYCADPAHEAELWDLLREQSLLSGLGAELDHPLVLRPANATMPALGVRYLGPGRDGALDAAGAAFLEQACRSAASNLPRGADVRSEIARLYSPTALVS